MRHEDFGRIALYRLVYAVIRERLARYYGEETPEQVTADPLKCVRLAESVGDDSEAAETIAEAVEDVLAGMRPRY